MKLKAIIVEDEETSRDILKNYLKKYCPNVEILGEAENVDEALILIRNNDLDLVFLDVEMPYGNAFDLLDKVGDIDFETIFVTAYNHYAIEALNAHASYYLMKPISIDDLIKAVDTTSVNKPGTKTEAKKSGDSSEKTPAQLAEEKRQQKLKDREARQKALDERRKKILEDRKKAKEEREAQKKSNDSIPNDDDN